MQLYPRYGKSVNQTLPQMPLSSQPNMMRLLLRPILHIIGSLFFNASVNSLSEYAQMFGPSSSRIASEESGTACQSPSLRPFLQSSLLASQSSQRIQRPGSQHELVIAAIKSHSYEKPHRITVNLKYGLIG